MMAQLSEMLRDNMVAVFFVYGLAFFSTGLTVILEIRRSPIPGVSRAMLLLAAFGLFQSALVWTDMFIMLPSSGSRTTQIPLGGLRVVWLVASAVALIQFASHQLRQPDGRLAWLRWSVPVTLVAWAIAVALSSVIINGGLQQRLSDMDVWARYVVYFPGSALTALSLFRLGRRLSDNNPGQFTHGARSAAVVFALNAAVSGLIVPRAEYWPASVLNYDSFFAATGIPLQIPRMLVALAIAFFVVRMLRIFESDHARRLEMVSRAQIAAQQQALQSRREAQEQLEREVAKRTEELRALHNIGTEISALLDLDRILESVVSKARLLLGADFAALSLLDEETGEIRVRATSAQENAPDGSGPTGKELAAKSIRLAEPYYAAEVLRDRGVVHNPMVQQILSELGMRSHLEVPLKIGDRSIGLLHVAQREPRTFSDGDHDLLLGLANQAAIAIENAHLYEQVQSLAIMKERERIAREMHDGLAQVFSFLNLKLINLRQLVSAQQTARAAAELDRMEHVLEEATADIRESILSLRTSITARDGLVPALKSYLRKYQEQTGVAVELFVSGTEAIRLSPPVEVQVLRIVQEALTNVRKHARANRAWVTFDMSEDDLRVCIEDNGRGFDLASEKGKPKTYGLDTMRERTQTIGGTITIDSVPERGTKVDIRVPRKFAEER